MCAVSLTAACHQAAMQNLAGQESAQQADHSGGSEQSVVDASGVAAQDCSLAGHIVV